MGKHPWPTMLASHVFTSCQGCPTHGTGLFEQIEPPILVSGRLEDPSVFLHILDFPSDLVSLWRPLLSASPSAIDTCALPSAGRA